jgi:hypothetical protein
MMEPSSVASFGSLAHGPLGPFDFGSLALSPLSSSSVSTSPQEGRGEGLIPSMIMLMGTFQKGFQTITQIVQTQQQMYQEDRAERREQRELHNKILQVLSERFGDQVTKETKMSTDMSLVEKEMEPKSPKASKKTKKRKATDAIERPQSIATDEEKATFVKLFRTVIYTSQEDDHRNWFYVPMLIDGQLWIVIMVEMYRRNLSHFCHRTQKDAMRQAGALDTLKRIASGRVRKLTLKQHVHANSFCLDGVEPTKLGRTTRGDKKQKTAKGAKKIKEPSERAEKSYFALQAETVLTLLKRFSRSDKLEKWISRCDEFRYESTFKKSCSTIIGDEVKNFLTSKKIPWESFWKMFGQHLNVNMPQLDTTKDIRHGWIPVDLKDTRNSKDESRSEEKEDEKDEKDEQSKPVKTEEEKESEDEASEEESEESEESEQPEESETHGVEATQVDLVT